MRQKPIIDRLKAAGLGNRVYGALELAGLDKSPGAAQLPAYFVVPDSWRARPNTTVGIHDQKVDEAFVVVIMVKGAPLREDRTSDELEQLERKVIGALAGWTHPDATRACDATGGRLVSVGGSTLSWAVSFSAGSRIRQAPA